ncbi:MAG TPA: 16S rRNA (cytosine(1402)-N(4))-methyltransferase RsmH [Candidatus Paceibacterota bacterium]|nr:16S rRNA (cytosine(1402)-N(4))-methyltransferase RsmH [Candidatus Paceibacterota bacterium]
MAHIPVLLQATIEGLAPQPGETVFDGTAGGGGHGRILCERIGQAGTYIGVDADTEALERVQAALAGVPATVKLVNDNFRNIKAVCQKLGIGKTDVILLDLGLSSNQLDISNRGFTFQQDQPLLMTFDPDTSKYPFTAQTILNEWDEENIATILANYGEEQFASRIAERIVKEREMKPFATTKQLVDVIIASVPGWYRHRRIHPATKTFQALRIAVNDELGALRQAMADGWEVLAPGGRLGIITFHSLEGRLVKEFFLQHKREGDGELLTKKAVGPERNEQLENPRSRSAQLRIIRKLA